jgi:hypothetical protein
MARLIQRYSGQGHLIFEDNQATTVNYLLEEFQEFVPDGLGGELPTVRHLRGRVTQAKGHPHWNPVAGLHAGPFTLVLDDGRKLKVFMENLEGSCRATGGFF